MKDLALYIHIPFCEKKCFYCDFISFSNREEDIDKYINGLIMELSIYKEEIKDYYIKTIFIGGGTPSAIDHKYIQKILEYIYDNFNIEKLTEVTIEVNPGTLTLEKAKAYKNLGINRISLGLQTTKDETLKYIGRIHTLNDFYKSYEILKAVEFNNINVDLIFGLPNQKLEDILIDLEFISKLDINHISYYSLIIEPNTIMYKWYMEGKLNLPDEETERQMYHKAIDVLKDKGYIHYEISNFAKKGYECIHNKIYWKVQPYIGIGISSHSNFDNKRFWNVDNLEDYFKCIKASLLPISGEEKIDKKMEMAEYCILGLRLINGVNKSEFKKRFNCNLYDIYGKVIFKHIKNGLLIENNNNIMLTNKGLDLANLVEIDFMP